MVGTGWVALVCSMAYGQAADEKGANARLEFEVASVKPAAPQGPGRFMIGMRGGPGNGDPGRITYNNVSLQDLMTTAYGVKRSQISSEPAWLDTERFDITAKVRPGASKEEAKVMLQNLLADRFKLVIHRETREMPMYALVVGKSGPKLKESPPDTAAAPAPPDGDHDAPPPPPMMGGRGPMQMGKDGCPEGPPDVGNRPRNFMMITPFGACMIASNQTMSDLADVLSNDFDRPVTDLTGLKGKYDFHLRFDPSSLGGRMGGMMKMGPPPGGMVAGGAAGPGGGMATASGQGRGDTVGMGPATQTMDPQEMPPTIFAALQEQLGLRLEPKKGPAALLVIDHVEKAPTEN
jgi:uncharacterized protein (TIGR03435 family)